MGVAEEMRATPLRIFGACSVGVAAFDMLKIRFDNSHLRLQTFNKVRDAVEQRYGPLTRDTDTSQPV